MGGWIMAQSFKETAHLKTDLKKLHANWDLIDWSSGNEEEDELAEALIKYQELHFKAIECCECGTNEGVKHDEPSCNDYCWPCLEKYLREAPDELFDSIDEEPDYNY
jgi:hypothetical protein